MAKNTCTEYIDVDLKKYCIDDKYCELINKNILSRQYQSAIFLHQSITAQFVALNIKAEKKMAILDNYAYRRCSIRNVFEKMIYTNRYYVSKYYNAIQRYHMYVDIICKKRKDAYTPKISNVEDANIKLPDSQYIVITPIASDLFRCWEMTKFEQIIKEIIDIGYQVALSVQENSKELVDLFKSVSSNKIYIYAKTSLKELIYLIQNAALLIGVDSAPIHIASALGIQAVCILGQRHKEHIYPYMAKLTSGTCYPICVQSEKMYCAGCNFIYREEGKYNPLCLKEKKQGNKAICVQKIEIDQVRAIIRAVLDKETKETPF